MNSEKHTGLVHSLESFGLADGPGVRFVVFLQGCAMRCRYCHNPDTWALKGEGKEWSASKLFEHVIRYKNYWRDNGGITVSGGEPLLQIDFVTEFFRLAKEKISTRRWTLPETVFRCGLSIWKNLKLWRKLRIW